MSNRDTLRAGHPHLRHEDQTIMGREDIPEPTFSIEHDDADALDDDNVALGIYQPESDPEVTEASVDEAEDEVEVVDPDDEPTPPRGYEALVARGVRRNAEALS